MKNKTNRAKSGVHILSNGSRRNRGMRSAMLIITAVGLLMSTACKKTSDAKKVTIPNVEQSTSAPSISTDEYDKSGRLELPIPENADRDNPYSVTTEEMRTMFSLIYEPLLAVDEAGKLNPSLAQSWTRSVTADNVWTVNLRSNVKWHDGSAFTAQDVSFSYNTLRNYVTTEEAGSYYTYAVNGIESITVLNETTVDIAFTSSGYSALYGLTFPIVCANTWTATPTNGTGPYKVTADKSASVTLSINQNWWKELPRIETIYFEERLNNETALASYDAGQLNFVPTSGLSAGKYRVEGTTRVLDIMTQDVELMIFNYNNSLLYDPAVRKAIAYAIDRSKLITNVYMNRAQACDVPIAPDSWLYSTENKTIEADRDYAISLLESAGYTDNNGDGILESGGNQSQKLSFTLLVNENTDNTIRKNAAEAIKLQLAECGIEINIVSKNYTLSKGESEYINALKAGEFDIALTGVSLPQSGDLTEFFKTDGALNFGGCRDETLSAMAGNILSAKDEATMRENAELFQATFVNKLPFVVLYFRLNSIVCTEKLAGMDAVREPNIMYHADSWYMRSND